MDYQKVGDAAKEPVQKYHFLYKVFINIIHYYTSQQEPSSSKNCHVATTEIVK